MTRSELIERLALKFPHLEARDAERVMATILDEITSALASGKRALNCGVLARFLSSIASRALGATHAPVTRWRWRKNTFPSSKQAKNCGSG